MVSIDTLRKLALSFPDSVEQPHFEKTSFRVNKKIFATLDTSNNQAVVKLSEIDQSVFCEFDSAIIYPVKGAWGKKGWTTIELCKVKKSILVDVLSTAYQLVSKKKPTKTIKRK